MLDIASRTTLNNGVTIPWLGLGVFRSQAGQETEAAIAAALQAGYRHIDTAKVYGNEQSVGAALRASGLPREDIFITTKLWNSDQGYDRALRALDESLAHLGLAHVDLYLVHWPVPALRLESWRALETALAEGKARAIGVSNYMVRHLDELLGVARVAPAVNQIELSPYNFAARQAVVDMCNAHNIRLEAYSPLTKGRKLDDPRLQDIARPYGKSTAQILLRYLLQKGTVILPKSTNPARIRHNAAIFDFTLGADDMARLDALNENLITGWDPTDAP